MATLKILAVDREWFNIDFINTCNFFWQKVKGVCVVCDGRARLKFMLIYRQKCIDILCVEVELVHKIIHEK